MSALRLLGGGLLVLAGALLGLERLAVQRGRLACRRETAAALGLLAAELETLRSPLGELFARRVDCPLFRLVSAGFGGEPLETLWARAAAAQPLNGEEQAALASLGAVLGRSAAPRQAAEIALVRRRLDDAADALEREIALRARRFPLLGAALGAIAAVMLI